MKIFTFDQLLIIGSLLEKEGMDDFDKKVIFSVIKNRLQKKMKLQIDATTIFANDSGYTFRAFNELKVFGTRTSLDGQSGIFLMSSDPNGKNVKMMTAFPSVITFNQNDFSNTVVRWDDEGPLFDDTTP